MIDKTIGWSLKNRLFVVLGGLLLLVWGGYEASRMPVDVFPDLTAPTVAIMTEAHGMAPEEVETLITYPIETAVNGAAGVRRVRSSTGIGSSAVWVEFDWGTDIYRARQIVSEKLQMVRGSLPPEVDSPIMQPITSIMGEVMFIALASETHSTMDLKTMADWTLRKRLLGVEGVAQVIPIGGDTREYHVIVSPSRLASYGITLDQVVEALKGTNENSSAGFYVEGGQEYLIQGLGRVHSPEEIGNTVLAVKNNVPILVSHVAQVMIGSAPKRGTGSHNGKPAVILGIQKQPSANTLELTKNLDRLLDDIQAGLPEGMKIDNHIFRQADFISVSIDNVLEALRDGSLLVVIIVGIFLASLRATFITLLAIPLSLMASIFTMKYMGITINTMTLGGMAIAIGALVDDAIIVVENVVRRLRGNIELPEDKRRQHLAVVYEATREIQSSIVFATMIIMLVFIPLFFLTGVEGRLLQPLGLAYVVSLAASLLVAITVTPVLSYLLLPRSSIVRGTEETALVKRCKAFYTPILDWSLRYWKAVTAASLAALAMALISLTQVGQSFLPDFNEGSLTVMVGTVPGTSLEESDRIALMVEKILLEQPEVKATARRTGRAELDEHSLAVFASEIEVGLKMKERGKEEFLHELREKMKLVPGTNVVIGQPISHRIDHMLSGTRANIAIKIFGHDLFELRRLADQVVSVIEKIDGVVDLAAEQQNEIPFISVNFDRNSLARYGLRINHVSELIETAFYGQVVSSVLEGQSTFNMTARYDPAVLENLDAVRATLITTPSGAMVPLHAIADIRKDRGPNTISRENVQRKIVVMANVGDGRDLGGVVDDVRGTLAAEVTLPEGYHVEYGGQFESAAEASRTLLILGAAVIVGIFLLLFVAFKSGRDALLVMLNLPLGLVGGVIGVYVSGGILSVASMIGFISLFGIATRNGVMMISHIRQLVEHEGVSDPMEAVRRGALERLVPILMTALTAGFALVPLALAGGQPGSEIQTPMAIVILFGLITSTALNMIVVPALYLRFGSIKNRIAEHKPFCRPDKEELCEI
ncbi:MAG: efflux RND transporter permease subunit [Desulfobulbaceae bacterium]|uniref:Efflux RND transporter permease subunit n=1 Tax=Candidatus Desulfobia pelagia TaxID=2841692 RepID=A0A8J6NBK2_9BACT|nr:efflux RND transporter permease subunit [Candidatus Desulfobia pelagia]